MVVARGAFLSAASIEVVKALDLRGVEEAARGVAPGLFPAEVAPLGEGMDHRAFLVGLDRVFRFPKHRHAAEMMEVERRVLPDLASRLAVPIPRYEHAGRLADGTPFVGYGLIQGEPLTPELVASLPLEGRDRLAADFAGFLAALHAFPPGLPRALGVRAFDDRAEAIEALDRARVLVFPRGDEATRSFVERRFAAFLAEATDLARAPALLHNDLWPEHVLYDRDAGRLAGVIDFDLIIADPDRDLIYPDWAGFLDGVLARDPHPDRAMLRRKFAFYEVRCLVVDANWAVEALEGPDVDEQVASLVRHAHA